MMQRGDKTFTIMACDTCLNNVSGLTGRHGRKGKTFRAAETLPLDEDALVRPLQRGEMLPVGRIASNAQTRGAFLHHLPRHGRHARGRRALTRAVRKNMEM